MSQVRGWQMNIDWSGGGGLTGPLEDVTNYVDRSDVTASWGRSTDGVATSSPTSQLQFALINRTRDWDRYFSPENASSPIYGRILPGKATQLNRTVSGVSTVYGQSSFNDGSLGGWTAVAGGTISRVTTPSDDGDGSLQYVPPGAVATVGVTRLAMTGFMLLPSGRFTLTMRVRATAGFSNAVAAIDWYDQAGAFISTGVGSTTALTSTVWTIVQAVDLVPPATAVQLRMRLQLGSTPPNTTTFNVDYVTLTHAGLDADRTYNLFTGVLDDMSVDSLAAARTFSGTALDAWGRTGGLQLSTPVYTALRTGDAINLVLDATGWTGPRAIDPGVTIIPYWWEEGTDPAEAIEKIVRSDGPPAIAYVEAGTFVFRDRHHRVRSAASTTSQGLFTLISTPGTGPGYDFKVEKGGFEYDHGVKSIINTAAFSVEQRRRFDYAEVWAREDPIAMESGDVQTIFAEVSDPVTDLVTPTVDNNDINIGIGDFTVVVDRTSGARFAITITCVATGFISRLALRGHSVSVARTINTTTTNAPSIATYGSSAWPEDLPWCNAYDAQAIGRRIVSMYSENRPRVSFTLVAFNPRYLSRMLSLRISDRITVRNDILGLNRDFHVEQLTHTVSQWQTHRLRVDAISAEPTQAANAFTFNVAGKGFNDGSFGLDGIDSASTMFIFDNASQGFADGQFAN